MNLKFFNLGIEGGIQNYSIEGLKEGFKITQLRD
jgi:hypothetical protein